MKKIIKQLKVKSFINRHSNTGDFNSPTYILDPFHPKHNKVICSMNFLSSIAVDNNDIKKASSRIKTLCEGISYMKRQISKLEMCVTYWVNHKHNKGYNNLPERYASIYQKRIKDIRKTIIDAEIERQECLTILNGN